MSETGSTVRALTCPSCGGTIALRAAGHSVSLVCEFCGTTLDTTRPDVAVIVAAQTAMHTPAIALGTRGDLNGTTWEAVGYLERSDGETSWAEYLLFNPYEGYGFLIDDGRRFSLGRLLDRIPGHGYAAVELEGQTFTRFGDRYEAQVRFVVGEFYWRVRHGERVFVTDYVSPGRMLSFEEADGERTWTLTDMLDHGVAEAAFGIPPRRHDWSANPAPHEVSPWGGRMKEALIVCAVALFILIAGALMASGTTRVATATLAVRPDAPTTTQLVGPIEMPDRMAALRIKARARELQNSWIDLDYSLVDRRTQASFDAYSLAEEYHGRDADGDWSEGDRTPAIRFSAIPRGTYDLVVEASAHRWQSGTSPSPDPASASGWADTAPDIAVEIVVDRGGIFPGNLVLAIFLILLWPAGLALMHLHFETRRKAPIR